MELEIEKYNDMIERNYIETDSEFCICRTCIMMYLGYKKSNIDKPNTYKCVCECLCHSQEMVWGIVLLSNALYIKRIG